MGLFSTLQQCNKNQGPVNSEKLSFQRLILV